MKVLLTGGAGYIGSHIAIELENRGHRAIIADNHCNSKPDVIDRLNHILGKNVIFYNIDVCDYQSLRMVFDKEKIDSVVHLAGYKAVGESVSEPLKYYSNNIDSVMNVLRVMNEFDVNNIVFSSSATVYGLSQNVPFSEDMPTGCTNPYGWTKWMIEQILIDVAKSDKEFTPILLRYFNPIGAHESGLIGENPKGIPNNLMPYIQQVAAGKLEKLRVFGDDYDTEDGTGVRDYIHVVDLAKGHVKALEYAVHHKGMEIINLGTGIGYSVLEVVNAFGKATGQKIPYEIAARREGDIAKCYADASKAKRLLNWEAEKTLEDMCRDGWRWQKNSL